MVLLSLKNISKKWHNSVVISSFNYDFTLDQAYMLVGANGRGKTTLLKIVAGLLTTDEGLREIRHDLKISWCSSLGVGCTPRLTGRENIDLFTTVLRTKPSLIHYKWLELEGFEDALDTPYGHCSSGMRMLIDLYISQLGPSELLVWDEPFAHLSEGNRTIIIEHWKELTQAKTLVFTTHNKISNFLGEVIHL